MNHRITPADVARLFPEPATHDAERGRGVFLAALRLRDAFEASGIPALFARVADWRERRRTAAALRALSDHDLADIGLTRGEIEAALDAPAPAAAPSARAAARRPRVAAYRRVASL